MGTYSHDTGSDTMQHHPQSVYQLDAAQLTALSQIIECTGRPVDVTFYAVSGDDVYAVFDLNTAPCTTQRFLYVKALYAGDQVASHYISEHGFFANQFAASQFACMRAREEEKSYGENA